MFNLTKRHAAMGAILFVAFALILPYQNCGGGGSGAFNLTTSTAASTSASTTGIFAAGPVVIANNNVTASAAISASSSLTGTASNGTVYCSWQVLTSANVAVGSPTVTSTTTSSCTLPSLTAPATLGNYVLDLTATNTAGTVVTQNAVFSVQVAGTTPVTTTQGASLTVTPASLIVGVTGALSAQVVSATATNLSAVIGTINTSTSVKTPLTGCTGSVSNATILSLSCNESFSVAGTQALYIDILINGALVQTCTNGTTAGCQGTYSVYSYYYTPPAQNPTPPTRYGY